MVFVGIDWAEAHHDLCLLDEQGGVIDQLRIADSMEGVNQLQAVLARHAEQPGEIVIGIELSHGLLVQALRAAGYTIYAINPMAASRYRDRHAVSKAKSDRGDAKMLADLVRTDRHNHRPLLEDSEQAEAIKVLARSQKSLIWQRQQLVNQLRSALREFYPGALEAFADDLAAPSALALLALAPTPARGRTLSLSKIETVFRRAGRRRGVNERARATQVALRKPQLEQPTPLSEAMGVQVASLARLAAAVNTEIANLTSELAAGFEVHPDAEIYLSLPGLGVVLGARVLGEFGDGPNRFADGKARRNYAGTSPLTKASGTKKVVMARFVGNDRLADACQGWAFAAIQGSPGARRYYEAQRARGKAHRSALRALANRLVGILHGCLRHGELYSEVRAWPDRQEVAA